VTIITKDTQEGHEFSGTLKTVTQERVNDFSGGFPKVPEWPKITIHTSLEFALSCGLPRQAASGAMSEGYLAEMLTDHFGVDWLRHGEMSLKFIAIVAPGDTVLPKAIVKSKQVESNGVKFVMEVWCENQYGRKVVVGRAIGLLQ